MHATTFAVHKVTMILIQNPEAVVQAQIRLLAQLNPFTLLLLAFFL